MSTDEKQEHPDPLAVEPCCGEYATCCKPCTVRGVKMTEARSSVAADPDRIEFLREAQAQLSKIIERGDIDAVRWMIQTAIDYHDSQESCADAMGMLDSANYHRKRRKELEATLATLDLLVKP